MRDHSRLIPLMLVLAPFAASAAAFPYLPASVPTHWGLSGKPDQFGSRLQAALTLPLVMLGLWALFGFVSATRQPMPIALVVSLGVIAIGNYMPRVTRRNAFIGVRLPGAFTSEDVWRRTQRAGGYGMVAAPE